MDGDDKAPPSGFGSPGWAPPSGPPLAPPGWVPPPPPAPAPGHPGVWPPPAPSWPPVGGPPSPFGGPPPTGPPGGWTPGGPGGPGQWPRPGGAWAASPRPPHKTSRGKLVALGVFVVVAMVAASVAIFVFVDRYLPEEEAADETPQRVFPDTWDTRIEPIAEWVADERDLAFEHPVEVDFLDEEAYREQITGTATDATDATDDEEADDAIAQLRALGLVAGEVDLDAAGEDLAGGGSLAYYTPEEEKVYVRGTELTPAVRVTVAHELTHVLQDQHFDLGRMGDPDFEESEGLRAMAEGDAERIETAYVDDVLTAAERDTYEQESQASSDQADEDLAEVPPVLVALFAAPYALGQGFVSYQERTGGDDIDDLLRDPPSEQELMDPAVRGTPAAEEVEVTVEAPEGAEVLDEDTFGPVGWFLLLAARGDAVEALSTTDGWGGDAYVAYREDDRVCIDIAVQGDDAEATAAFEFTATAWSSGSPGGDAEVTRDGDVVTLRSCDPGADADATGELGEELLAIPYVRADLESTLREQGAEPEQAACVVDGVFAEVPTEDLLSEEPSPELITRIQETVGRLVGEC